MQAIVVALRAELRTYDPIVRVGGTGYEHQARARPAAD
jgi:hypothetical protein